MKSLRREGNTTGSHILALRSDGTVWSWGYNIAGQLGDGKTDIAWRNRSSGENYLYPMDGTAIKGSEGYVRGVPPGAWMVVGKQHLAASELSPSRGHGMNVLWDGASGVLGVR